MEHKPRNVYHRGAMDGLAMGAYLTLIFFVQVLGLHSGIMLLASEVLILGVPVLAYILLRRAYLQEGPTYQYSAIWMQGITMFICGCLILGLIAYIFFRFIRPTFIAELVETVANVYRSLGTEEGDRLARIFQNMEQRHLLPKPIEFAFSMMWVGSFAGAMLSMLLAGLLKLTCRKKMRIPK